LKIQHKPSPEEVRRRRAQEYRARFPVETQLEALTEAAQGRPEKLEKLKKGLSEIRESLPFCSNEEVK
jgi:hypothetical protein